MDSSDLPVLPLQLRQAHADFLRTTLRLGFTLLDVACSTRDPLQRHHCICSAMNALEHTYRSYRTADAPDIQEQREELRERLVRMVLD